MLHKRNESVRVVIWVSKCFRSYLEHTYTYFIVRKRTLNRVVCHDTLQNDKRMNFLALGSDGGYVLFELSSEALEVNVSRARRAGQAATKLKCKRVRWPRLEHTILRVVGNHELVQRVVLRTRKELYAMLTFVFNPPCHVAL